MTHTKTQTTQYGITLVELMVAMVIGLLLAAGISQVFVSSQQTYRITEEQSRLQENARFALEFITRDVREAGYTGCRAIEEMNVQTVANAPVPNYTENSIINGNEATSAAVWAPALNASISGSVVGGTDTITIQKGSSCGATLITPMTISSANIKVSSPNSCNLTAGDALMISDCQDAHIFRAGTVSNGTGSQTIPHPASNNTGTHFCINQAGIGTGSCGTANAKLYGADSELLQFTSLTYYIRQGAGGRNALWVFDNTEAASAQNPMELIEGVEDMQVTYGVDTTGDDIVDAYQTANTVNAATNWINVISAEISLLVETQDDNLTTDNMTYTYNGATVTSADNRLRRVFTTVIGIRNRVQ
jgi:type IV pilus assembly protein PilW